MTNPAKCTVRGGRWEIVSGGFDPLTGKPINIVARLCFEAKGVRHFVWRNDTGALYKAPPVGVKAGQIGFFNTRKLNALTMWNERLIRRAKEQAGDYAPFLDAWAQRTKAEMRAKAEKTLAALGRVA